jgi:hypothetical protein
MAGGKTFVVLACALVVVATGALGAGVASAQTVGPVSCGVDPEAVLGSAYPLGGCTVTLTPQLSLSCGQFSEDFDTYHLEGCRVRNGENKLDCGQYTFSGLYGFRNGNGCIKWGESGGSRTEVSCGRVQVRGQQSYDCTLGPFQVSCGKTSWPSEETTYCRYSYVGRAYCSFRLDAQPLQNHSPLSECIPRLRD